MTIPIAAWHADHFNFTHLLDLLEKEVVAFSAGEHPNYALMQNIVYYLRHYPDRYHHPREDVAFARLVELDPALQLPIARRVQEHRVLAAAGEDFLRHLDTVINGGLVERAVIETAAATYLVYYRCHIAAEEQQVRPRAAQLLSPRDWAEVANAVAAGVDPLFGDHFEARYRELRRQIAVEAQEP